MKNPLARWLRRLRRAMRGPGWMSPPDPGPLAGVVAVHPLTRHPLPALRARRELAAQDAWFHSHYVIAPNMVVGALQAATLPASARILDLGCGDGIMALGVCEASERIVVGSDLTDAFQTLPGRVAEALGDAHAIPSRLGFAQAVPGAPLPFPDDHFDAGYSWSVFEHVDGVDALLREVVRVLKPGARFFLQIEPLYYSPFGSHLRRLIPRPWAHLNMSPADYLAEAAAATDQVRPEEKDVLYQLNAFESVKRYLIGEYASLNRITSRQLVDRVLAAGLLIERCELGQVSAASVPSALRARFPMHDLRTQEIRLMLRRPQGAASSEPDANSPPGAGTPC